MVKKKNVKNKVHWETCNVMNKLKVSKRGEKEQREKFRKMMNEYLIWYKVNYKNDNVFWSLVRGGKNWHLCLCDGQKIIVRLSVSYTPEKKSMSKICTNLRKIFDNLGDKL